MEDHLQGAIQLIQAQRFPEARQLLRQFTKKQPKHAEGWFLLGQVERALKNWPAALDALRQAQRINPQALVVTEHLAMVQLLSNQGRELGQSITNFATVLQAAPDAPSAVAVAVNLQTLALRSDRPEMVVRYVEPFHASHPVAGAECQRVVAGLSIAHFLQDHVEESAAYAAHALTLKHYAFDANDNPLPGDYPFYHRYVEFIQLLLEHRRKQPASYGAADGVLHTIGDSHALTLARHAVAGRRVEPHLLMGAKAFMLTSDKGESWQYIFKHVVQGLPKDEPLVVMLGEIDCRTNEGIMQQWAALPDYDMEKEVAAMVAAYVKFVKIAQLKRLAPTFIHGVPAPSRAVETELLPGRSAQDFLHLIGRFNACLKHEAEKQGLGFIDIHAHTVGSDGWARDGVHLDKVHLTPAVMAEAFAAVIR